MRMYAGSAIADASRHVQRKFVRMVCWRCDRPLHDVLVGTEVMCPVCNHWYVAEPPVRQRKVS